MHEPTPTPFGLAIIPVANQMLLLDDWQASKVPNDKSPSTYIPKDFSWQTYVKSCPFPFLSTTFPSPTLPCSTKLIVGIIWDIPGNCDENGLSSTHITNLFPIHNV